MANENTSATGGFLYPTTPTAPNDQELEDILQPWIVGLSGLDGSLVRPLQQEDPPPRPPREVTWISLGVKSHRRDWSAFNHHVSFLQNKEDGSQTRVSYDEQYRNEELEIILSCYGPTADATSAALWNNAQVAQNREYLYLHSLFFTSVEDPITVSEKIKQKWLRRVDLRIRLRRGVSLRYPVLDLESVPIDITAECGREVVSTITAGPVEHGPGFGNDMGGDFGN